MLQQNTVWIRSPAWERLHRKQDLWPMHNRGPENRAVCGKEIQSLCVRGAGREQSDSRQGWLSHFTAGSAKTGAGGCTASVGPSV